MKLLVLFLAALPVVAQTPYRKHTLWLGAGAGLPRADLRFSMSDSFGLTGGYGYRFHRFFQAEVGLDTLFGAAGVRDYYASPLGDLRIRDFQYLVPFGGRVILPVLSDRLQFHGGVGGAYLRYAERIRQPFGDAYYRLACPVCEARSGWGSYGLLGASVALDRWQHFRFHFNTRVYRGGTRGGPIGAVPGRRTTDRWVNMFAGISFNL